ncbi:helix-turn-helix transcriptional regulator [Rhodopirellula europaea]|uniref:helix-turn-helix transcriptional regulator n=1 Tax=Rhodopirellula europaea TaxID=1263866 RepID=UPI003D2A3591|tara:strand:- start:3645 stop:4664 length:1020 start_codon:yes stop_codon:yes gene_type:complete
MSMGTQRKRHPQLLRLITLGRGEATIESLAGSLGVSEKTVRRDIAGLRQLGIAIQEHVCRNGRKTYRLSRESIGQVRFTYDEAFSWMGFHAGTTGFNGTSIGDTSRSAFEKIQVALGGKHGDHFGRISPWRHRSPGDGDYRDQADVIDTITLGIEDSRVTTIVYRSAGSTEPVSDDIHPYVLAEHNGALHVVGHSCHHGEIRTWTIDRMESAEVTELPFVRPADFRLSKHFEGAFAVIAGNDPVTVRIRFRGSAARNAAERKINATQTEAPGPGGSLDVSVRLTSTIEIKSYVLSFGASAEGIEPESLRTEVAQELQQALTRYASDQASQSDHAGSAKP